jgi:uncharacterized FlaG/YvyC family protein
MSIQVPRVGSQDVAEVSAVRSTPHVERTEGATRQHLEGVVLDTLPGRPPVEVLDEMQRASERYDEMRSQQRELHFRHDDQTNRVVVEVRDLDGNVLRTVPPSKALDIISGEAFE